MEQIREGVTGSEVGPCVGGKTAYPAAKLMESVSTRPRDRRASPRQTLYCQATDYTHNPAISDMMPVNTGGDTGNPTCGTDAPRARMPVPPLRATELTVPGVRCPSVRWSPPDIK